MKKNYLILIIGCSIFLSGLGVSALASNDVSQKYPNTKFLIPGETLEPFSAAGGLVEINNDGDFFIGVTTFPLTSKVILSLADENDSVLFRGDVTGKSFQRVSALPHGLYKFEVLNPYEEPVQIIALFSDKDISEDFDGLTNFSGLLLAGISLVFIGLMVMIIVGIIIIIKKIRVKSSQV